MEGRDSLNMYVGTYAGEGQESIFLFRLFPDSGEVSFVRGFKGGAKPSYLAFDAQARRLFAVNEHQHFDDRGSGAVCSFSIDEANGFIELRNRLSSRGALPAYVEFISEAQSVVVANYASGNIAVFPLERQGRIGEATDTVQHHGSGPNAERQASPHVHQTIRSPDGRFLFVVDLGIDQILGYTLEGGTLAPTASAVAFATRPGWGPRQLVFHPDGRYAYLAHELKSMVSALRYDSSTGTFEELQAVSSIPNDFHGENKCGGIDICPNGRTLYVSNRGHDSIAVFSLDEKTKKMTHLENKSTEGRWPRELRLDPSGQILVVANQESDAIVALKVDQKTGKLRSTGFQEEVEQPVFVGILRV